MGIVFDLVFIAIIVAVIVISKNKGFVASCLDTLSLIISSIVSFLFTKQIADAVYNFAVRDLVKTSLKNALDEANKNLPIAEKVSKMVEALPESARKLADYAGVNIESLKQRTVFGATYSDEDLVEIVADNIAYDIMILVVQAICFMVLFVAVSLVVKFASSFLSKTLSKLPVVGKLDSGLGAVFGLVKGIIIVIAASVLFTIIVATAEVSSPLLAIEDSYIYTYLKTISPMDLGI